jgi:alpha-1,2-mannosyltransferase
VGGRRTRETLELGLLAEVSLVLVGWLAWGATKHGFWFYDFTIFRNAGRAVLHGTSPYVAPTAALLSQNNKFVYPTPYAFPFAPFALIPPLAGKLVFLALSITALAFALRLLGVRDRRCLAVALFGAPVFVSLAIGTISPLLLLLVAAAWRYRDRPASGVLVAVAAAAKLFLWPLLIWLLATRRLRASAASLATVALIGLLWAMIDLNGLRHYPTTLTVLNQVQRWKTYSPESLAISLNLGAGVGEILTLALAAVGVAVIVWLAQRPDGDRRSLSAAVALALLTTPILWLHYLIVLLVPIALFRARLSPLWLVPVALWVTPGTDSMGSPWRIATVLVAIAAVAATATLEWAPATKRMAVAQSSLARRWIGRLRPD